MEDLQRKQLVPLQKSAFMCAAACCDKQSDMAALQNCTLACQQKVQAAHQVLYGALEDFQVRCGAVWMIWLAAALPIAQLGCNSATLSVPAALPCSCHVLVLLQPPSIHVTTPPAAADTISALPHAL